MPQGRKTSVRVIKAIRLLTLDGYGPAQIERDLLRDPELRDEVPGLRTIQRHAEDVRPPDASGEWSMLDAPPEEAARVIDVVTWAIIQTEGRVRFTRGDVKWIARVRTVDPEVPAAWALYLAMCYRIISEQPNPDSRALDLALGGAAWESAERTQAWADACRRCGILETTDSRVIDLLEFRSKIDLRAPVPTPLDTQVDTLADGQP
jgi:hypothetical protein